MDDSNICPVCGGVMEDMMIQIDFRYKGNLVVIEGVPSQVCIMCGEQVISATISKDIDKLLASGVRPVREIRVPVVPYRHMAQA